MSPHRKLFTSLCVASTLALTAAPVLADDDQNGADDSSPSQLAHEGAQKLILALELMLQAIPQYAMPEILENGDIVIRRINPEDNDDNGSSSETKEDEEVEETEI